MMCEDSEIINKLWTKKELHVKDIVLNIII